MCTRGTSIVFPPGAIKLDVNTGEMTASPQTIYDPCVPWIEILLSSLEAALKAQDSRRAKREEGGTNEEICDFLAREFAATSQCVVAAAIVLDALYDRVKPMARLPDEMIAGWQRNKTARHKQISETLRRTFKLNNENSKKTSELIRIVFKLRDATVHPSSKSHEPGPHPELKNVAVDWRLFTFRGEVAQLIASSVVMLVWQISNFAPAPEELKQYLSYLKSCLQMLMPEGPPKTPGCDIDIYIPEIT